MTTTPTVAFFIAVGWAVYFTVSLSSVAEPQKKNIEQEPPPQIVRKDDPKEKPFWATVCVDGKQYIMTANHDGVFSTEKVLRIDPNTFAPMPCKA